MTSVNAMIEQILHREGGFVNHPNDRGGATNFGVTIGTYSRYLGRKATVEQVRVMTKATARDIYKRGYYEKPRLHLLHGAIQAQMFDCSINHGSKNPVKWLQSITNQALGGALTVDGMIGAMTAEAVNHFVDRAGSKVVNNALVEERIEFFEAIMRNDPTQEVFRKGWIRRAKGFLQ